MAKRFTFLLAIAAAMLLMTTGPASAGPVTIHDDSKVLDASRVTTAANAMSNPVQIFTTEKYSDDNSAFDNEAQKHVVNPTDVVIAVNTKSKHGAIRTGKNSHITDTSAAQSALSGAFTSGDYTGGIVTALQDLAIAAGKSGPGSNRTNPAAAPPVGQHHSSKSSGFNWLGILCPVIVVGLIVAAVVAIFRRRGRGGGFGGGGNAPGGYGGGGYGGGGYGPGYNQGGGMSPGMAGGLGAVGGAVGGGLLGYELGKMEGRDEERDRYEDRGGYDQGGQGGYDQGSQDWGGGGGDFGSNDTGDFGGGGGSDSGGGGDF